MVKAKKSQLLDSLRDLVKVSRRLVSGASLSGLVDAEYIQALKCAQVALDRVVLQNGHGGSTGNMHETSALHFTDLQSQQSVDSALHTTMNGGLMTDQAPNKNTCPSTTLLLTPQPSMSSSVLAEDGCELVGSLLLNCSPLWAVILSSFYWRKPKMTELAISAVQRLSLCPPTVLDAPTVLFLCPQGRGALGHASSSSTTSRDDRGGQTQTSTSKLYCRVGEAIFLAASEYLMGPGDAHLQQALVDALHWVLSSWGSQYFHGKGVTRVVRACFHVCVQSNREEVRAKSRSFLRSCAHCVTQSFIREANATLPLSRTFATDTELTDHMTDVDYDADFCKINILPFTLVSTTSSRLPMASALPPSIRHSRAKCPLVDTASNDTHSVCGDMEGSAYVTSPSEGITSSYNPTISTSNSVDETIVSHALLVLNSDGRLPTPLKDFLVLLRHTCRLASRPCTGSPSDNNPGVRARLLALEVLEVVFCELPVANAVEEHRCAGWLALVLGACKYDLMQCVCRNLATANPFCFYDIAVRLLGQLLRKCHYPLAWELHTVLTMMLFPLTSSRYADFRQKHAVLAMLHDLFKIPHLLVSFYINYDCYPGLDAGDTLGGMLEAMIDFVSGLTFTDYRDSNRQHCLTSDQQQLLRTESLVALHTFVQSMYRWISEDPKVYALSVIQGPRGPETHDPTIATQMGEMYVCNSASDEDTVGMLREDSVGNLSEHDRTLSETNGGSSCDGRASSLGLAARSGGVACPHWQKVGGIHYHWKHIHHLLQNKRIAQAAVRLINEGKWVDAKTFLESKTYIARIQMSEGERNGDEVPAGCSSYMHFARFLKDYPGIDRLALSGIFERITTKKECRFTFREYLHCFQYRDVPIDVALRDTTCTFMSWERPMFEAQVWEAIQATFGAEYASQNRHSITEKDADTMAGVLLFLHSNLHNEHAKGNYMTVEQFVKDGNACLDFPLPEEDLRSIFARVKRRKWQLDEYGRTPQQAEMESALVRVSTKVKRQYELQQQQQLQLPEQIGARSAAPRKEVMAHDIPQGTGAPVLQETWVGQQVGGKNPPSHPNGSPASTVVGAARSVSADDCALLDSGVPFYSKDSDDVRFRDENHQAFANEAMQYLFRVERGHRLHYLERERCCLQPYILPHYAEHVRPMFLSTYSNIVASTYMGFRVLESAPVFRQLYDTLHILHDIAAALTIDLGSLHSTVERTIQLFLHDEKAYKLLPPTRVTFCPYLMNVL